MLERQDIDALLVGALYGELSSTEQAQLTAHLESHPADRSALDDLKAVRAQFTTSRIFEVQLDPPQAVSALLLQEAARRAPKQVVAADKKESWFDRFVRSFIAHPAMAAAATLVLVVGVAGTIYLEGNSEMAQPRIAQKSNESVSAITPNATATKGEGAWGSATMNGNVAAMDPAARAQASAGEPVVAMTPTIPSPTDQGSIGAGDFKRESVAVGLDEDKIAKTGSAPKQSVAHDRGRGEALAFADDTKQEIAKHAASPPAKAPKGRYVEVPKDSPQPKELEQEQQDVSGKDAVAKNDRKEATRGAGPGAGAAGGGFATATTTAPTAPPVANGAPAPTVADNRAAAPPPPPAGEPAPQKTVAKPDSSLAWAKDQHAKIIALVKDGKCSAAVPLAATLKTRAPDYYATNVATDRSLKSCMQYVNDSTTEKAAEKRATKATDSK
ncbi:MAG: hypothetical protein ABJE66_10200 [Deltaproteobacteria bacterium]